MKKNLKSLAALALLVPALAACSNQNSSSKKTSSSSVAKSSTLKKNSAAKTSTSSAKTSGNSQTTQQSSEESSQSSSSNAKQSSSQNSTDKSASNKMNFAQIKQGNYSSLAGNWKLVKAVARHQEMDDDSATLTVSKDSITDGSVTLTADGIKDQDKTQPVKFTTSGDGLVATLKDESVSTNWSVSFYPAGSTNLVVDGEKQDPPTKNTIVIWTSNNNFSEVFEQK